MNEVLLALAVLPVVVLCFYIYIKDVHKEPFLLLFQLFTFGILTYYPIYYSEVFLDRYFSTDGVTNLLVIFVNVFFGVALVEEGFKWLVTKFVGYNSKSFNEIYDVIVYSVFASLGFACIENILYVKNFGFDTAVRRALLSVPGHACFGVIMGYFLAKAKISTINNNKFLHNKNIYYSIFIPTMFHTIYDTIILYAAANYYSESKYIYLSTVFYVFDIFMIIACFLQVRRVSKIQRNFRKTDKSIVHSDKRKNVRVCPVCGKAVRNPRFCVSCGTKFIKNGIK